MLSVIMPVRCGAATRYLVERLAGNLELFGNHPNVECVVVDSASEEPFAGEIRRLCRRPRCQLVLDPAPQWPFAPGMTRNAGAAHAGGDLLLFYDVDLCVGPGFVDLVLAGFAAGPAWNDFLVIPSLFLTPEGTRRLGFAGKPVDLEPARASLLAGENHLVGNLGLTHLAVSRRLFLRVGGNRPEYRGHGCEDYDLLHRLASYRPRGKRAADYYDDVRAGFPGQYRGFRAYLAGYALPQLFTGPCTAHLWHPRPVRRDYFRRRRANEALLQEFLRSHDAGRVQAALPDDRATAPLELPAPWSDEGTTEAVPVTAVITELMARHGLTEATHPGLFRWRSGVAMPPGTAAARLRKLILRPREFFADSRFAFLRPLGRGRRS